MLQLLSLASRALDVAVAALIFLAFT